MVTTCVFYPSLNLKNVQKKNKLKRFCKRSQIINHSSKNKKENKKYILKPASNVAYELLLFSNCQTLSKYTEKYRQLNKEFFTPAVNAYDSIIS